MPGKSNSLSKPSPRSSSYPILTQKKCSSILSGERSRTLAGPEGLNSIRGLHYSGDEIEAWLARKSYNSWRSLEGNTTKSVFPVKLVVLEIVNTIWWEHYGGGHYWGRTLFGANPIRATESDTGRHGKYKHYLGMTLIGAYTICGGEVRNFTKAARGAYELVCAEGLKKDPRIPPPLN